MGIIVKFPEEGRVERFGRSSADGSARVIILPVVRIERHDDVRTEHAEPRTQPPANGGRRRRARRR